MEALQPVIVVWDLKFQLLFPCKKNGIDNSQTQSQILFREVKRSHANLRDALEKALGDYINLCGKDKDLHRVLAISYVLTNSLYQCAAIQIGAVQELNAQNVAIPSKCAKNKTIFF